MRLVTMRLRTGPAFALGCAEQAFSEDSYGELRTLAEEVRGRGLYAVRGAERSPKK